MRNRIRELRRELGLSQNELAQRCGVSRLTVLSIELDRSEPSLPLAFALARELSTPIESLFQPEDDL
ncbi:helix-turn-helix transcriptional regulator [Agrococcus sp. 1P02AA]|uniref:helix-turn-helix transcriptional regulator n=1 Tax=Agrococcus sp. 1P02AA TaxID=3132259 RepID=UPI0039A5AC03